MASQLALGLAACGGGGDDSNTDSGTGGTAAAEFNAANGKVFNPSDKKGGTIKMANSSATGTRSTPATPTTALLELRSASTAAR